MLKEVKCLSCQETLYRIGPLDEKGRFWGIYKEDEEKYETIRKVLHGKEYFECPQCRKKNWIQGKRVEGAGFQEWISRVSE